MTYDYARLAKIKCFLFDMDGTINLGNELIPGMEGFFDKLKAAGKDNENFGVFACDGTNQALKGINDGTCMRGTMYFEALGSVVAKYIQELVDGKTFDAAIETPIHAVTKANIADYYKADK